MRFPKPLFTVATVAALSVLSAGTAFAAGEFLDVPAQAATSTTSRAAVQADVLAARAAGTLAQGGEFLATGKAATVSTVTLSRDAVRADVRAARAAGELATGGEFLQAEQRARSVQAGRVVAQNGTATVQQ
jgi:hypothetical protein